MYRKDVLVPDRKNRCFLQKPQQSLLASVTMLALALPLITVPATADASDFMRKLDALNRGDIMEYNRLCDEERKRRDMEFQIQEQQYKIQEQQRKLNDIQDEIDRMRWDSDSKKQWNCW